MRIRALIVFATLIALSALALAADKKKKRVDAEGNPLPPIINTDSKKKKKNEDVTQALPVLKDPPSAIVAEPDRLIFRVAPLSNRGLLSAQVRDALRALMQVNKSAVIVKLRAFVVGTGDMRRVQTIVSEMFTERKLALPVVTTVQAGALPLDGAQVVIESIAVERKAVNPQGIAFLASMPLDQISAALKTIGIGANRVLRASCFVSSIEQSEPFRNSVQAAFPGAPMNFVQMQRTPVRTRDSCEVVAMLEGPVKPIEHPGVALINAPRIVMTGAQMAFNSQDSDIRLAFQRLGRTLESMNVTYKQVVAAHLYPLADDIEEKMRKIQGEFFNREHRPVLSVVPMEALPAHDASFALEVIAAP